MTAPFRILFVCHGNICRSPMAEFVMKDLVERRGLDGCFSIASAATHGDEIGSPVHPGTRGVLEAQVAHVRLVHAHEQVPLAGIGAAQAAGGLARAVDALRLQLGRGAEGRCRKLLEFAGSDRDVADPWYTGDFDVTYDDVLAGCTGLLSFLVGDGAEGRCPAVRG